MIIEKKVDKDSFEAILKGLKRYEVRLGDFDCKVGDILVLKEKDPVTKKLTGREIKKKVTFIYKVDINNYHWSLEEIKERGLQYISFE